MSRCGHRPVTCAPARGGLVSPRAIRPLKGEAMYKGSAGVTLPTSIIGSLPRPSWYTAGLGSQSFLEAKINLRYREQYEDAVSVYLRAQETAGLDILTDGDAHFDEQTGAMSWQSYPLTHMAAFLNRLSRVPIAGDRRSPWPHPTLLSGGASVAKDYRARRPGNLQYTAMWKVTQPFTTKPVKFGIILPELLAFGRRRILQRSG